MRSIFTLETDTQAPEDLVVVSKRYVRGVDQMAELGHDLPTVPNDPDDVDEDVSSFSGDLLDSPRDNQQILWTKDYQSRLQSQTQGRPSAPYDMIAGLDMGDDLFLDSGCEIPYLIRHESSVPNSGLGDALVSQLPTHSYVPPRRNLGQCLGDYRNASRQLYGFAQHLKKNVLGRLKEQQRKAMGIGAVPEMPKLDFNFQFTPLDVGKIDPFPRVKNLVKTPPSMPTFSRIQTLIKAGPPKPDAIVWLVTNYPGAPGKRLKEKRLARPSEPPVPTGKLDVEMFEIPKNVTDALNFAGEKFKEAMTVWTDRGKPGFPQSGSAAARALKYSNPDSGWRFKWMERWQGSGGFSEKDKNVAVALMAIVKRMDRYNPSAPSTWTFGTVWNRIKQLVHMIHATEDVIGASVFAIMDGVNYSINRLISAGKWTATALGKELPKGISKYVEDVTKTIKEYIMARINFVQDYVGYTKYEAELRIVELRNFLKQLMSALKQYLAVDLRNYMENLMKAVRDDVQDAMKWVRTWLVDLQVALVDDVGELVTYFTKVGTKIAKWVESNFGNLSTELQSAFKSSIKSISKYAEEVATEAFVKVKAMVDDTHKKLTAAFKASKVAFAEKIEKAEKKFTAVVNELQTNFGQLYHLLEEKVTLLMEEIKRQGYIIQDQISKLTDLKEDQRAFVQEATDRFKALETKYGVPPPTTPAKPKSPFSFFGIGKAESPYLSDAYKGNDFDSEVDGFV